MFGGTGYTSLHKARFGHISLDFEPDLVLELQSAPITDENIATIDPKSLEWPEFEGKKDMKSSNRVTGVDISTAEPVKSMVKVRSDAKGTYPTNAEQGGPLTRMPPTGSAANNRLGASYWDAEGGIGGE